MNEKAKYLRFTISDRVEHWVFVASFATLAITGLVQKYASLGLPRGIIGLLGGIETVRIIHHVAAVVMMFEAIYHIGVVGYKVFVRRTRLTMMPNIDDLRVAWDAFRYNLGQDVPKPQQGRYTFEEKVEYWAVIWGTVVMGITGFMMWNPIATTHLLPGEFVPAAKAAHGGEALLAVMAIIVWHLYHVHLRHLNLSMISGYISMEEMLEDHPLELADLKAGIAKRPVDRETLAYRRRTFFPAFAAVAVVMLAGIIFFVAFEKTAIKTIPPAEELVVFAPLTPTPLPTPLPTHPPPSEAPTSWINGFGELFQEKCGICHGSSQRLGGLDLSTYQSAIAGGNSGSAIVPGNTEESLIIKRQASGDHPGQFSGDELAWIHRWIEAGAPENE